MLFRPKHVPSQSQPAAAEPSADAAAAKAAVRLPFHKRLWRDWIFPLVLVAAVFAPIRASVADWNDVPSGSMRPTILEGDRIYVNKLAYGLRIPLTTTWLTHWDTPERGEIVTLKSPADGVRLVKRVVGLPGDRLSMRGNRLFINGIASEYRAEDNQTLRLSDGRTVNIVLAEEQFTDEHGTAHTHALTLTPGALSPNTFEERTVPAGHYFVMGDNRDMSRDSRAIGFVPLESIYGRSGYIALSLDPTRSYRPRWDRWFSVMR